jgi:hypothetical protein
MKQDVEAHGPFDANFILSIHGTFQDRAAAELTERRLIDQYKTRTKAGYNSLPGTPRSSAQFWYLLNAGKLAKRK